MSTRRTFSDRTPSNRTPSDRRQFSRRSVTGLAAGLTGGIALTAPAQAAPGR